MSLTLLTPPPAEPVTVAEVKLALRFDDTRFDALLPGLISAARQVAEQETGQQLVEQTWRAELADWPAATDVIAIYRATAAAVTYWYGAAWVTLSGSAYVYAPSFNGTVIAPALGTEWPDLAEVAVGARVRIDLTAGVATAQAGTVPACIKTFIIALVGQIVQTPELSAGILPAGVRGAQQLLDSQRLRG